MFKSEKIREIWTKIWENLFDVECKSKNMFESLLGSLRENLNFQYMSRFKMWIQEIIDNKVLKVLEYIGKYSIILNLMCLLKEQNDLKSRKELIEVIRLLLNQGLVEFKELLNTFSYFIMKVIPGKPEELEDLSKIVTDYLKLNKLEILNEFLSLIQENSESIPILIQGFHKYLFKNDHNLIYSNHLLLKLFSTLTKISPDPTSISPEFCESLILILVHLSSHQSLSFTDSPLYSIHPLISILHQSYKVQHLSKTLISSITNSLFNSDSHLIRFPSLIPLYGEVFCNLANLHDHEIEINRIRASQLNIDLSANHYLLCVILSNLKYLTENGFWKAYEQLCLQLVSSNFNLFDLNIWVKSFKESSAEVQGSLLKILRTGVSLVSTSEQVARCSYFHNNNKVFLNFSNENLSVLKDFSALFWVFYDFNEKSVVLAFKFKGHVIEIFIENCSVIVKINNVFDVFPGINRNSWNLICVNFSTRVNVIINGNQAEGKEKKIIKIGKLNKFEKFCVGNNFAFSLENYSFAGLLNSLLILKKSLELEFLKRLFELTPGFIIKTYLTEDNVLLKELKDLVLIDLLDTNIINGQDFQGVYYFKHIPVYKSIKVYGLRRLMNDVFKSIKDSEVVLEFFKLVKVLIYINSINRDYFTDKSFEYLSQLICKTSYSPELCEIIISILDTCSENHANLLQNVIKNNHQLIKWLQKNHLFYNHFLAKYTSINPLTCESLLTLIQILLQIETKTFSDDLSIFFKHRTNLCIDNSLPPVINYYISLEAYDVIFKILSTLNLLKLNISHIIMTLLIEMMDKNYDFLQVIILEIVFFSDILKDFQYFCQVFNKIDSKLPNELNIESIQFFLSQGFDKNSKFSDDRFEFLWIIVKRLRFFGNNECKKVTLQALYENSDDVAVGIIKSENFNEILIDLLEIENSGDTQCFIRCFLEISIEKNLWFQVKVFFYMSKDLELFKKLVLKYSDCEFIKSILPSFEVLQAELEANIDELKEIFVSMRSQFLVTLARASIDNFRFPGNSDEENLEDGKELVVDFINFLIFGLCVFRQQQKEFPFFDLFFSSPEINYLNSSNNIENPHLKSTETYLSVYILIEILQNYLKRSENLKPDLIKFISKAHMKEKLTRFCEKHSKIIENSLREVLCTDSMLEINREKIESKVELSLSSFKKYQQKLSSLIDSDNIESSDLFTDNQSLSEIIRVIAHVYRKLTIKPQILEQRRQTKNHEKLQEPQEIQNYVKTSKDLTWVFNIQTINSRKLKKISQNYKFFNKNLKKVHSILNLPRATSFKLRQIYDNSNRWSTFKPLTNKSLNSSMKSSQIPSTPEVFIDFQEFSLANDSDSPNISDNSAAPSRENTMEAKFSSNLPNSSFLIERIQVKGSTLGHLTIGCNFFDLNFEGQIKSPDMPGALSFTRLSISKTRIFYSDEFSEIIPKRFLHKHTAIEFILKSGKSYYINFFSSSKKEEALKLLESWQVAILDSSKKPLESFKKDWKKGNLNNFDYLMLLNKFSSRSMNDLSQYPIFPWIVNDYTSQVLHFDKSESKRNFKFPIGAQRPEYQLELQVKYDSWKDDFLDPYHHGSHYSNGGIVLHYLVRIEPFSTQARLLQGGNYDIADRLFYSLETAWGSCIDNAGTDNKELVPEMFYMSFAFDNIDGMKLGRTSRGIDVSKVIPPNWAVSNWDFIIKHRNLLESWTVSKELHNWIDLIFGFKQNGKNALSSFNVFSSVTYEGRFDEFISRHENLEYNSMVEQVYHFGQTPQVLFEDRSHPVKEEGTKTMHFYNFFYKNEERDMAYKNADKPASLSGKVLFFHILTDHILVLKKIKSSCSLTRFQLKDQNELIFPPIEYPVPDLTLASSRELVYSLPDFTIKSFSLPSQSCNSFAVMQHKYLVAALDQSHNVQVFDLKGKLVQSLAFHSDLVLSVCAGPDQFFSGSFDSSIKSWTLNSRLQDSFQRGLSFFGHKSPVFLLKVIHSYSVLVSCSDEGLVLVHDTKNAECLHSVKFYCKLIDVHEYGLVLLADGLKVKVFGVNLDLVAEYEEFLDCLKFCCCGSFIVEACSGEVFLKDYFNGRREICDKMQGLNVADVGISCAEKGVLFTANGEKGEVLGFLKLVSLKQLESKNEIILDLI